MIELEQIRKLKARRDTLAEEIERKQKELEQIRKRQADAEVAVEVIQEVAKNTQEQVRYHLCELVSMALASVFPDPYELEIEFVSRRGKTEADVWFVRDGERVRPIDSTGGGAVDIAAFALRVCLWSISRPQPSPVIILDEPFRFVSVDMQEKASKLLKELSEKLDLQIIAVSHKDELSSLADKVFKVTMTDGVSNVEEVE